MGMRLTRIAFGLSFVAVLVTSASAQTLGPKPDPNDPIWFSVQAASPEECYKFGIGAWVKKTFIDRKGACQCVKCGWSNFKRLCWKAC